MLEAQGILTSSLYSVCLVSGFLEAATVVGGPGDPNLQSVHGVCLVSGFLETAAMVGSPGDPNLQSLLCVYSFRFPGGCCNGRKPRGS